MTTRESRHERIEKIRRDLVRRVSRQFAGVEYIQTRWQPDGTAVLTFITYDDNVDDVMEYLSSPLEEAYEEGVEVLIVPYEDIAFR